MSSNLEISKHDLIKGAISSACKELGLQATQEYKGKDWRADVHVVNGSKQYAFEIQISPQNLERTLERQGKYIRDYVSGCWLFESPPSKLLNERPDLPIFYVIEKEDKSFSVSLSGRKELQLGDFLREFLNGKIKFCMVARTAREQKINMSFYEMTCWKCGAMNHLYYVEPVFRTACNGPIHSGEIPWRSNRVAHRPDVIALAREFMKTDQGKFMKLGNIKQRFSKTVDHSYLSFGCYACDSLFGEYFVIERESEIANGYGRSVTIERSIQLEERLQLLIPHWCYPGELEFCDLPIG